MKTIETATLMTSSELLARDSEAWRSIDSATRLRLTADLPAGTLIVDALEDEDMDWRVHHGDLRIVGSLINGHPLVILGDLVVAGSYDDDGLSFAAYGQLFVTGDLSVEHVVSWASLHVDGALHASGLVLAYYNDWTFEVRGELRARGLVVDDRSSRYPDPEVEFEVNTHSLRGQDHLDRDEEWLEAQALQAIPNLRGGLFDLDSLDQGHPRELMVSYEQVKKRVRAGRPLFRDPPAGPRLIERLQAVLDPETATSGLERLMSYDPLVAHVGAYWREDLPKALVVKLIEQGDPLLLDAIVANSAIARRLRRRAAEARLDLDER